MKKPDKSTLSLIGAILSLIVGFGRFYGITILAHEGKNALLGFAIVILGLPMLVGLVWLTTIIDYAIRVLLYRLFSRQSADKTY